MYRNTSEFDDLDTINKHRRRILVNPNIEREQVVIMTVNIMNVLASRILDMEVNIIKNNDATATEHGTSRLIADIWQTVMKMIHDENFRTTATIGELEHYSRMLGAYARLINQTISMFESLVKS